MTPPAMDPPGCLPLLCAIRHQTAAVPPPRLRRPGIEEHKTACSHQGNAVSGSAPQGRHQDQPPSA
eukprot:1696136-Karenia_brevis.AAC.1